MMRASGAPPVILTILSSTAALPGSNSITEPAGQVSNRQGVCVVNCAPFLTALCLLSVGHDASPAPTHTARAWTMLEEGAANGSVDTRARAVESLGLLV